MGWSMLKGQTRAELLARRTAAYQGLDGARQECLRYCTVGNVLWTVWEITAPDKPIMRFIGCDLMAHERGYGWGYKDLCESEHPFYYSCPLAYLDLVETACADWRAGVHEYHRKRSAKNIEVGDVLVFEGLSITEGLVIEKRPGPVLQVREIATGCLYRCRVKHLACVVEVRKAA